MSDLPTREAELFDPKSALGRVRSKSVVSEYVNRNLLTREEAANDREVILKVMRQTWVEQQRLLGNEVSEL